jgi:hypothetical protein
MSNQEVSDVETMSYRRLDSGGASEELGKWLDWDI